MFFRLGGPNRQAPDSAMNSRRGILSALLHSKSAATLPMVAAAILPMIGIIGGGVDMSRIYLVKTRLQQACDAGALAARRAMSGITLTSAANTQGQNFFSANLRNGAAWGANGISVTYTANSEGAVDGTANANVPMLLMKVFGFGNKSLQVTCQAQLNVANNDVLFVLDTTGSMACRPSDSSSTCTSYAGSNITTATNPDSVTEKSNSRIDGLRAAVNDFAVILAGATSSTARLRIGFISYSSGINLGSILTTTDHLRSGNYTYPTRLARFETDDINVETQTYGSNISQSNCVKYGNNQSFSGFSPSPSQPGVSYVPYQWGSDTYPYSGGSGNKSCKRRKQTNTGRKLFSGYTYADDAIDITSYVAGNTVGVVTGNIPSSAWVTSSSNVTLDMVELAQRQAAGTAGGMTVTNTRWDGCVLERATGPDDMLTAPTSNQNTRWAPIWKEVIYSRSSSTNGTPVSSASWTPNYVCPKASMPLTQVTTASLSSVRNYVNVNASGVQTTPSDFLPHGRTYHDIGMIWATRLMAPSGMFSGWHGPAPNGRPVTRSIIFMTDGDMDTGNTSYSSYGFDSSGNTAHNNRFVAACAAARNQGINLYVISFAQTLTSNLIACADDPEKDFEANNTEELQDAFSTIAQRIAELRLTQ